MSGVLKSFLLKYSDTFLSRWTVLLIDSSHVFICYFLAIIIRNNFELQTINWDLSINRSIYVTASYVFFFLIFGSYKSVIRQTGIKDSTILMNATLASIILNLSIALFADYYPLIEVLNFSKSVLIIHFLLTLFSLLVFRFVVKGLFFKFQQIVTARKSIPVLIYGSGALGDMTRKSLEADKNKTYRVAYFLDDNVSKQGKRLDGVMVLAPDVALTSNFLKIHNIQQIILSINKMDKIKRKTIIEKCISLDLKVKVVPSIESWIREDFSFKSIKPIVIEDLLGRDPIDLDNPALAQEITGRRILITGAAGSIGSEIARQVVQYYPKQLVLIDKSESALYELQMEVSRKWPKAFLNCQFIISDITRYQVIEEIFKKCTPQVIYHAAAYKHVPLMEQFPIEAARVNIIGTRNVADLACKYDTEKFIMVSTDKAINPTNVMGATKRVAEMYIQSKNIKGFFRTSFITTRFGNVLGSNGSVVPQFKKQIEEGGPVTITHPEITRYFMTISEACNLVLEAGAIGSNSQILVFDMGQCVKIVDLAENMIRLMGLEPYKDIDLKFTGLRPGEKLKEELISSAEENVQTHHPKIMISKSVRKDNFNISEGVSLIEKAVFAMDAWEVVMHIKQLVPEFISNNSIYGKLDLSMQQSNLRSSNS
jgi:FlaA1/EpsC-like NDP-sugar epimerase